MMTFSEMVLVTQATHMNGFCSGLRDAFKMSHDQRQLAINKPAEEAKPAWGQGLQIEMLSIRPPSAEEYVRMFQGQHDRAYRAGMKLGNWVLGG